jgi:uncharacterized protein YbjT (DUF2867 family)
MAKILVTGATGNVGGQLVAALTAHGAQVRAAARSVEDRSKLESTGAEVVTFDYADPDAVARALVGVERLFLLSPFTGSFEAEVKTTLDAAAKAGVKFVLRSSAFGAAPDAPISVGRQHGLSEQHVQASGIDWAVIRPTFFQDNLFTLHLGSLQAEGRFYGASGTGKVGYISSADIAAVAAAILTAPEAHVAKTYALTGPEALSDAEVAEVTTRVTGRKTEYVDVSAEQLAGAMRSGGAPEWMIEDVVGLERVKANGWAAELSPAVPDILGRPGEPFQRFLERHRNRLV